MSKVKQLVSVLAVALAIVASSAATAGATTINFNSNAGTGSFGDGSVGNVRTWVAGGITVTATAWYANSNNFLTAALGLYSGAGLATCNSQEWGSSFPCSSPDHAIDNDDEYDFVQFNFSSAVNLQEVGLYTFGGYDYDVSFWLGNGVTGLAGKALNNMPAGFGSRQDVDNDTSVDLQPGNLTYTSLLFGAQKGDDNDRFKVKYLTFDVPSINLECGPQAPCSPTPEPGSLVLMGTGLVGFATLLRRRARRA
jgi:PEP-CTERM motif-containing protein